MNVGSHPRVVATMSNAEKSLLAGSSPAMRTNSFGTDSLIPVMNKLVLSLLISLLVLCGCAHQYVMKLTNGMQVTTASKPKLKGGNYYFKDAKGREVSVPQGRVREIEPASMTKEEKPMFKPTSAP